MKTKQGAPPLIFVILVIILVISVFAVSVLASSNLGVPSLTPKIPGYDKDSCPDLGVNMIGSVNIQDSAIFDLEPSLSDIDVKEVKVNGRSLFSFGEEPFTYTVEAFRVDTNQKLGNEFVGTGILRDSDNEGINKPWSISFLVPDNDCNSNLDDFDVRLQAELKGADIGDVAEYSKLIQFRNGGIIQ